MLLFVLAYLLSGLVFALAFAIKGVTVIDEGAEGTKPGFRLIIIPGAIIFWPVLLIKWVKAVKNKSL